MYPVYRHLDSHHPRGSYMPPAYWYSPSCQAFPGHNSSKNSAAYETWPPSPNNYGFLAPGYGCCGHASSLHYPYPGPSHQFHCCGHHPPYPGPFCTPYLPPPLYYQMEQNPIGCRRGDGLSSGGSHCCECPNHTHNPRSDERVKADKQEPDPELNQGDSQVPLHMKDKSYPMVWIPTEHMKNVNDGEAPESRISSRGQMDGLNNEAPGEKKKKPSKQHPTMSDGWFPLDMKDLASLFGNADNRRSGSHQNGDQKQQQLQFPLVWLPSHQMQDKGVDEFESNDIPNASKFPVVKEDSKSSQGSSEEKVKHERTIPVVEAKPCEEDEKSITEVGSARAKDNALTDRSGTNSKRQSPSQAKSARLPPVCLRVDPLPKKRNGSSRPPCPPGSKGTGPLKAKDPQASVTLDSKSIKEEEGKRSTDSSICREVPENKSGGAGNGNESAAERKERSEPVTSGHGGGKAENKELSDEEAARLIQSVYRGYEVRKWEPLKKLKQIAGVREQVTEVRNQIRSLETSSDYLKDDKARVRIGEMIMNLLLKLDGIQGLHPSLREIRKSLAKELVTLQEKLDSVVMNKPEEIQTDMCISSNNTISQEERIAEPRRQLLDNPSQYMENNCNNGCDIIQPSLTGTGVVKAYEEMESPARHDPEFKVSDGGTRPRGKDEIAETDVRAVSTDIEQGRSESCDAIAAGAPSLKGAGTDPNDEGTSMAKVDEVMQINDGPHHDGRGGLAQYDEVIAPRKEDTEEEKKRNSGGEGIKEVGSQFKSPMEATEEEKCRLPATEDDGLAELEQLKVPAEVTENEEHTELCEALVLKSEDNVAAEQKMDAEEGQPAECMEASTMESAIYKNVAANKSVDLNVEGEDENLHDVKLAVLNDQSSESEPAVYCSRDRMLEEDLLHHIPASGLEQEMLIPEKKETQLNGEGSVELPETQLNDGLVEQEQLNVLAEVTENKDHRELWEALAPKSAAEDNVAAEQKTDAEEGELAELMESALEENVAAKTTVDLNVESEDEALHDDQSAVLKDHASESEPEVHCSTDGMLEGDLHHHTPASDLPEEMHKPEKKEPQLNDEGSVELTETNPNVAHPKSSPEEILPTVGLGVTEEQNLARDRKLVEENGRLREMLEKLLEAGNEQMETISKLTGRVSELEKKLHNKRKNNYVRTRRCKAGTPRSRSSKKKSSSAAAA